MKKTCLWLPVAAALLTGSAVSGSAAPEGDSARGARAWRLCATCHSLTPGVQLTGPSLAGAWGRKVGADTAFPRYSRALVSRDVVWDEVTLNAWIAGPDAFAPGTYMTFEGLKDDAARADLVAFLQLALVPDGAQKVIAAGLISEEMAKGQVPEPVADAPPSQRVTEARYCRNSYFLTFADGSSRPFWEVNLRLKVDAGPTGPRPTMPVFVSSGMMGDRGSLIFSALSEVTGLIKQQCLEEKP